MFCMPTPIDALLRIRRSESPTVFINRQTRKLLLDRRGSSYA